VFVGHALAQAVDDRDDAVLLDAGTTTLVVL
jgi:hypothetical protein